MLIVFIDLICCSRSTMYSEMQAKDFPEFFTTKGPIYTQIVTLKFGNGTYWMSTLADETVNEKSQNYMRPYEDNEEGLIDCMDFEENYDIVLTKTGKFMTSFYVPSSLLSFVIGPKGNKLKHLQRTTNTLIKVPRLNEKGDVKITGDTERRVASARTQICMIVFQRKDKLRISHFISIPLNSDLIKNSFEKFKQDILKDPPRGVTESIFQNPNKLHLTVSVLTLVDDEELSTAQQVLQSCYEEVLSSLFPKNKKYSIVLEGLEIMNDDPSEVNVLYGNVHMESQKENQNMQEMADKIAEYYYKSSLTRKQYDRVKLHATLLNTRFRNPDEKKEAFDATYILEKYGNYCFGIMEFNSIHLSIRFTTGDSSYYEAASVIEI